MDRLEWGKRAFVSLGSMPANVKSQKRLGSIKLKGT